jgi:hypothetical protein
MKKLNIRERCLLTILGALFPLYPAVSIMTIRHGNTSGLKLLCLSVINSLMFSYFVSSALDLKLKIGNGIGDIADYLDSRYSKEEQQVIIKNYGRYKSSFFQQLPLFTRQSQIADPTLRKHRNASFRAIGLLLLYGFIYLILLLMLFYVFVWI